MVDRKIDPVEQGPLDERETPVFSINVKRILARAIRYWYLVLLSVVTATGIAWLVNRYTTRIYPVTASIIVREGDENAGAKFLYNNALVNPYRNFFNELYIMRSYPLLQEVVEQLNLSVAWYREGNIKTLEMYDPEFPIQFTVLKSDQLPYGRSIKLRIVDKTSFELESQANPENKEVVKNLHFNDTLGLDGYKFFVRSSGDLDEFVGKEFVLEFKDPYALAKQYSGRLKASWAEQGASVVNLDVSGPLPRKEIDFLRKFIERYQQYDINKKNLVATKSIEFLDRQLAAIKDSLSYFDSQIEDFKGEHLATDFNQDSQRILQHLEDLEIQRSQILLQENYFNYLIQYLKTQSDLDQIVPPSVVGISDAVLADLIQQLVDLQFSLRMLGSLNNETNPLVTERKAKIEQLKKNILEGVKSSQSVQRINRDFLEKEIALANSQLKKLPESERAMTDIKRNYTIRENLFLFLMQKRAEAGISRASTTSDIIVVNPPSQVGGPITPKPIQNYTIALAGGLFFPFIFFFLSELTNDKIQSKEDIVKMTSIPLIGGIGHNTYPHGNLVVNSYPKSALAESFRALRSNLYYFTQGKDKKIILITSSVSGEGKTFSTINLATVMAFAGKKVLIIGADMRKPRIFQDFDLTNEKGLSSYLSSMATLSEVIQKTKIENLDLISGGPVPPNPSELLLQARTETMLNELIQTYDYVILDTPPVGLVSDAFTLIPYCDHTVFLIRQNYTPRHFLEGIDQLFAKREVGNVSILFNDIVKTGPGYGYGYSYGYSYGYGGGYGQSRESGGYYSD